MRSLALAAVLVACGGDRNDDDPVAACERAPGKPCVEAAARSRDPVEVDRLLARGCDAAYAIACHTLALRATDPVRALALEIQACGGNVRDACERLRDADDAKARATYAAACDRKILACGPALRSKSDFALVDVSSTTATDAYVDGNEARRYTLPSRIKMSIGAHTLTLIAGDKRCERTIDVKRGPMPNLRVECR